MAGSGEQQGSLAEEFSEVVSKARRINRTWITRGGLAANTEAYLEHLEDTRPEDLDAVCEEAVRAARQASQECRDPKPAFYASVFSKATRAERNEFLKDHFFTRLLSAELQLRAREEAQGEA